jgi:hypothetical protein
MLPDYILKDKNDTRHNRYKVANNLYYGDHYKVFNINEQEYKNIAHEYICHGIIKQAIDTKVDLIWHEKPLITFEDEKLQKEWDKLRADTNFDETLSEFTRNIYLTGDSVLKIVIDQTDETSQVDDYQVAIYNINPTNWIPDYTKNNPNKYPSKQSFKIEKEVKDSDKKIYEAYLIETHTPGQIIWTAYREYEKDKYQEINPIDDWEMELQGVLETLKGEQKKGLEIVYETQCDYSLIQFARNNINFDDFYSKSDLSLPVISKLNTLNNYSNLADTVIVSNVFPKLLAGEGLVKLMNRIVEEINQKNDSEAPISLLKTPTVQFANGRSYLKTQVWKDFVNETRIIPNEGRGETKYLQNDFDLEQLRKQSEIFLKAIMTELGISEVLYNSNIATGALSGVAYKRLLTLTINEIEHTKRILEPFIKKCVYTILQLAKTNSLITSKPDEPSVVFFDGIVNDQTQDLADLVLKVQNNLLPLKEAIMQANDVTKEQAEKYLTDSLAENMDQTNQNMDNLNDRSGNNRDSN